MKYLRTKISITKPDGELVSSYSGPLTAESFVTILNWMMAYMGVKAPSYFELKEDDIDLSEIMGDF